MSPRRSGTFSGLDNRCHGDARWPGHASPSGGGQRVMWRSGVCPDMCPGIDTGLESSKKFKLPGYLR